MVTVSREAMTKQQMFQSNSIRRSCFRSRNSLRESALVYQLIQTAKHDTDISQIYNPTGANIIIDGSGNGCFVAIQLHRDTRALSYCYCRVIAIARPL